MARNWILKNSFLPFFFSLILMTAQRQTHFFCDFDLCRFSVNKLCKSPKLIDVLCERLLYESRTWLTNWRIKTHSVTFFSKSDVFQVLLQFFPERNIKDTLNKSVCEGESQLPETWWIAVLRVARGFVLQIPVVFSWWCILLFLLCIWKGKIFPKWFM